MVRAIQRRPDQRIHAGGHADIGRVALRLQLRDPGQQHPGLGHQVAPGLQPEGQMRVHLPHAAERSIELRQIEFGLAGTLRNAQAPAHIHDLHVREPARQLGEQLGGLFPVRDLEDATAAVRVQAHDPGACGAD